MKRTIIALAVLCAAPAIAAAQANSGGVGLKGGLSYGNVSNSGALPGSNGERSGFAAGISINSGGAFGLGLEGLYAQRGVTSSLGPDSRRLDYIDVPLYLRLQLPSPVAPFFYAGPQVSYEVKCETDIGDCPDTDRPRWTYAGVIGAGLRFGWPSGLSLEGRYIYGLQDLKLSTISSSESYKTRSFLVLLGIGY